MHSKASPVLPSLFRITALFPRNPYFSGSISNASVLSEGTRALDEEFNGKKCDGNDDCDICKITNNE